VQFTLWKEDPIMLTTYDVLATWLRARFGDSERGASLVEYALLVALIAVVCIAAVTILGKNASNKFDSVGNSISG
jgi:pilus assembly protein Flp/PilA